MEKHYVIRKHLNGNVEQAFEGTLKEAIDLQFTWGSDEIKNYDTFEELIKDKFFGDGSDGYVYIEVSEEEYNQVK